MTILYGYVFVVMCTLELWTYKLWTLFCGYGLLLTDLSLIQKQLERVTLAPTHPQIASTSSTRESQDKILNSTLSNLSKIKY